MTNIGRVQITNDGYVGGPGVTTFYCLDPAAALPELKGLMAGVAAFQPADYHIHYPTAGDMIDPINGTLTGGWTAGARAGDVGTAGEGYAAPVGGMVDWHTGDILDGHRLTGRSYFVPLVSGVWEIDGSLNASVQSTLQTLATAKVASLTDNLVVWHRPRKASVKHPVARDGGYSVVTSAVVPSKAAVLRSRRS
jgi:hypothetical protein